MSNAIKYNRPQGSVAVTVGIDGEDASCLCVTVEDTGRGIPPSGITSNSTGIMGFMFTAPVVGPTDTISAVPGTPSVMALLDSSIEALMERIWARASFICALGS